MAHSNIGPSSAKRWMSCPGSVALCETIKTPEKPSKFAAEGVAAHTLAEELVTGKCDSLDLMGRLGTKVKTEDGFEVTITDEMIEGACEWHDMVLRDAQDLRSPANSKPGRLPVEGKAEMKVCALSVDKELTGTCDYAMWRKGDTLYVSDYKFGKGVVVEVEDNEQLLLYAIGVMDTIECWAFDRIILTIHQPRAPHAEGRIRRWEVPVSFVKSFAAAAKEAVARTRDRVTKLTAGDWCRWCRARGICPELANSVAAGARADFSAIAPQGKGQDGGVTPEQSLDAVRQMTTAQLGLALAWEGPAETFFGAVREVIREKLEAGEAVPGWKLVEGRAIRQWKDEAAVVATYEPTLGKAALFEPPELLSPAKLEKVVGKSKEAREVMEGLTYKPEVPRSVARESDPRRAVEISSAAKDFAAIGDPLA